MSSAAAGTFGFMAPEQIRNLKLTNASDLYGLGLTLICLIGAIRSTDIGNYIDFSNQLDRSRIEPKLKGCSLTFVKWLDQMVAPDPSKRFADAATALDALKPLYVVRVPSVKLSRSSLGFTATKLGEKLSQTITLTNSIPETVLEGKWEIEPHPNDPPHTPNSHDWIFFSSKQFKGNQIECQIIVDTSKLIAQANGTRSILLQTNAAPENYTIPIEVVTAPLPLEAKKMPYLATGIFLIASVILGYLVSLAWNGNVFGALTAITIGYLVSVGIFAMASISGDKSTISENKFSFQDVLSDYVARLANQSILAGTLVFLFVAPFVMPLGKAPINVSMAAETTLRALMVATNLSSILLGSVMNISTIGINEDKNTNARFKGVLLSLLLLVFSCVWVYFEERLNYIQSIYWNLALSCGCSWLMTTACYHSIHGYLRLPEPNRCNEKVFHRILILSMLCGSYIGFCLKVGFFINIFVSLGTLGLLGLLVFILFNPSLQHKRAISAYRRKEEHLIKP